MNLNSRGRAFAVGLLAALMLFGCERSGQAQAAGEGDATAAESQRPSPHKARPMDRRGAAGDEAKLDGNTLSLLGVAMTVPEGWKLEPVGRGGPMAPKAIFTIPNDDGRAGTVRLTHFPGMKGKDKNEMNISRWVGQVTQPDGSPSTREDAKIETVESNGVTLTIVDLSGSVKLTMRDTPQKDQRMIAAIVDHPKGPHFVVAAGPIELMKTEGEKILAFLKSAEVR